MSAADVVETCIVGEIAARVIAAAAVPRRRRGVRHPARMVRIAREAMMAAHHGADAVEHHRPADDTRYGRGSRAKE